MQNKQMQLISAVFCITTLVLYYSQIVSTHYTLKIQCVKLSRCKIWNPHITSTVLRKKKQRNKNIENSEK